MLLPVSKKPRKRLPISGDASPAGYKPRGLVYAEIELISGDDLVLHRRGFLSQERIKRLKVNALVDSGAYMLVINQHIKEQLDLPVLDEQTARLADESEIRV